MIPVPGMESENIIFDAGAGSPAGANKEEQAPATLFFLVFRSLT